MRPEDIMKAVGEVDDRLLAEAEEYRSDERKLAALKAAGKRKRRRSIMTAGLAAAACLVAVIGAPNLIPRMGGAKTTDQKAEYAMNEAAAEFEAAPEMFEETLAAGGSQQNSSISREELPAGVIPLACAVYPERTLYPGIEECEGGMLEYSSEDADIYQKIYEENRAAGELGRSLEKSGLTAFTKDSMQRMLAKANASDMNGSNALISPVNLYTTFALLAETTSGNSEKELLKALHADSKEDLREFSDGLFHSIYMNNGNEMLIPASSIWLKEGEDYRQETLAVLADRYYADSFSGIPGSAGMDDALHGWLNGRTNEMLKESVDQLKIPADSEFTVASTLLYAGHWAEKFSASQNEMLTFHAPSGDRTAEFLTRESAGTVYFGDSFTAYPLYTEDQKCMWAILPNEGETVDDVIADDGLYRLLADPEKDTRKETAKITLKLPKFDISARYDLKKSLIAMGLSDLCDPDTADFTALCDRKDLALGGGEHMVRVAIDEEGITAAAASVLGVCGAAMPPEKKIELIFDRPFVFALTGQGNVYYAGVVNEP